MPAAAAKNINDYNLILDPESRPLKKFLPGEIALAAAAAALFISYYNFSDRFAIRNFYRNFDRQTRNEIINSYIFRRAYPEICEKYGYRLKTTVRPLSAFIKRNWLRWRES